MLHHIRTIDAHTAGEPLRLIVGGFPTVEGATILEKREWLKEHCDHLRTALMLEPRGHADMYGAILTEAEHADSDAGVLFMHNEGYSTMCGHGIVAVVTIALERGLLTRRHGRDEIVLDSPAGPIRARAQLDVVDGRPRVSSVKFENVPSFVLHAGLPVKIGTRTVPADVAFGGAFYASEYPSATRNPMLEPRSRACPVKGCGANSPRQAPGPCTWRPARPDRAIGAVGESPGRELQQSAEKRARGLRMQSFDNQ